ncbi:hypothetical protein OFM52_28365, partial [Escherichia coli]|nr:hypothetical protein [Escherichia coli]
FTIVSNPEFNYYPFRNNTFNYFISKGELLYLTEAKIGKVVFNYKRMVDKGEYRIVRIDKGNIIIFVRFNYNIKG